MVIHFVPNPNGKLPMGYIDATCRALRSQGREVTPVRRDVYGRTLAIHVKTNTDVDNMLIYSVLTTIFPCKRIELQDCRCHIRT